MRGACFAAFFCMFVTAASLSRFSEMQDRGRYFELNRRLRAETSSTTGDRYYSAIVDSRFGRESEAISRLSNPEMQEWLSAKANARQRLRAHEELGASHLRLGQYRKAASQLAEALRFANRSSEKVGLENTRLLANSLADVAAQTVEFVQGGESKIEAVRNAGGTWDVPVEVNGTRANWVFDTGANLSVVTESEAVRMGVKILQTKASVAGSTGKRNHMKLAVADSLRIGPAILRSVVLVVLPDEALRFPQINVQIKGFLGLTVIRALECVALSRQGGLVIGKDACLGAGSANLFFDELSLIVEAIHNGHPIQFLLDTGANNTDLYPSSRPALKGVGIATRSEQTGGAGQTIDRKIKAVPRLSLQLGGKAIELQDVTILSKPPNQSRCRDGLIGMDGLGGGFHLDFRTMQFRMD